MFGLQRFVLRQPVAEQVLEFVRQTQQYITRVLRARAARVFQQRFEFTVGEHRNQRRDQHGHRNARL